MGVTSEVEIMNSALIKVGAEIIVSADEDNNRARLCKTLWPLVRNKLLHAHPWNFAISYVELAAVDPKPADVFDYGYVFQLPANCLRVLETDLGTYERWEEIEGSRIAAELSTCKVKFIKQIEDTTKYSASFVEAAACALAAELCFPLTQSTSGKESFKKEMEREIANARSFDAQVGSVRRVIADDWLDARRT